MLLSLALATLSVLQASKPLPSRAVQAATDVLWHCTCRAGGVNAQGLQVGEDVEIREARGRGLGVYAKRSIPAGTMICRYWGVVRTRAEHEQLAESGRYAFDLSGEYIVDAEPVENLARYINHSVRRENCQAVPVDVPDLLQQWPLPSPYAIWLEAKVDIEIGSELLYDYGAAYWDAETPLMGHAVHGTLPKSSWSYRLHARLNPRRVVIDLL